MIPMQVISEIDRTIKDIWLTNIVRDYEQDNMLREDSLKCCLYYHLRRKLSGLLKQYNLRIYPEFYFKDLKYRADLAIVELDPDSTAPYLGDRIKDVAAIFELKYAGSADSGTEQWIKNDVWKIKDYIQTGKLLCQYYLCVIYEVECSTLNWLDRRSTRNWANGYVTELDAGYLDGQMWFEVNSYNNMNLESGDGPIV